MHNKFYIDQIHINLGEIKIDIDKKYPDISRLVKSTGIKSVYETKKDIVTFSSEAIEKITKKIDCMITVTQSHDFFLPGM